MMIFVDVDNTLCRIPGDQEENKLNYELREPWQENIEKSNRLFDSGHTIIMWTARGTTTRKCWFDLTMKQLRSWGVRFHELRMGKPSYDLFIDDRNLNAIFGWNDRNVQRVLSGYKPDKKLDPVKIALGINDTTASIDVIIDFLDKATSVFDCIDYIHVYNLEPMDRQQISTICSDYGLNVLYDDFENDNPIYQAIPSRPFIPDELKGSMGATRYLSSTLVPYHYMTAVYDGVGYIEIMLGSLVDFDFNKLSGINCITRGIRDIEADINSTRGD